MAHTRTSHVGLVYRPSDCPSILKRRDLMYPDQVDASRPLLIHVIASGECGPRDKPEEGGMDIVDLEVWLKDYLDKFSHCPHTTALDPSTIGPHTVAVRSLLGIHRGDDIFQVVEDTVARYKKTPFEACTTSFNVVVSQMDLCENLPCCRCFRAKKDTSMLFCSELVAEVYIAAGLLSDSLNPSEFVPAMWDTTRKLHLQAGIQLSKEHFLAGPRTVSERKHMGYPDSTDPYERHDVSTICGPGGFFGVDVARPTPSRPALGQDYSSATMLAIPVIQRMQE